MDMPTHRMVNGQRIELSAAERAAISQEWAEYSPPAPPPAPTREQLLAQLAALTAKIEALW
jgi:hypothetical protein